MFGISGSATALGWSVSIEVVPPNTLVKGFQIVRRYWREGVLSSYLTVKDLEQAAVIASVKNGRDRSAPAVPPGSDASREIVNSVSKRNPGSIRPADVRQHGQRPTKKLYGPIPYGTSSQLPLVSHIPKECEMA
jgi:hypothetical protein